jgi:hypothetical protein
MGHAKPSASSATSNATTSSTAVFESALRSLSAAEAEKEALRAAASNRALQRRMSIFSFSPPLTLSVAFNFFLLMDVDLLLQLIRRTRWFASTNTPMV